MITVLISVSSSSTQTHSRARLWVEPRDRSSIAETEIALAKRGPSSWAGSIPRHLIGSTGGFLYRLAIMARPGSLWSLQLVDEETSRPLECDCDVMDDCKTWLVGTCTPARALAVGKPMAPALRQPVG